MSLLELGVAALCLFVGVVAVSAIWFGSTEWPTPALFVCECTKCDCDKDAPTEGPCPLCAAGHHEKD